MDSNWQEVTSISALDAYGRPNSTKAGATVLEGAVQLAGVLDASIADGPGFRMVLFAQGCPHGCPACHNPQTHPFSDGNTVSFQTIIDTLQNNPLIAGVTFSGGEPLCQAHAFATLAKQLKHLGYNVMTFTGYTLEELLAEGDPDRMALLAATDILVDGRFDQTKIARDCFYRGSTNQRIFIHKTS